MSAQQPLPGEAASTSLLGSVRTLASTLIQALQTRFELAATEIEEERIRLTRLWLLATIALFLFALSVIAATLFVIVLFWDTHRLTAIAVLFLCYLGAGCAVAWHARKQALAKPRLLSATLNELAKDRQHLI